MADKVTDIAATVKVAAELEPIVKGVNDIAEHVAKSEKRITDDVNAVREKQDKDKTELEGKMTKGFADVLDRIDHVKDSFQGSVLGSLRLASGPDFKALLPDEVKNQGIAYEVAARNIKGKESPLRDPATYMAASEYMRLLTMAQSRKWAGQSAALQSRAAKLFAALEERAFGPNWESVHKAAYAEGAAGTGGNLVPTIVDSEVLYLIRDAGSVFPRCRQFAMTSNSHKLPSENTAVSAGWAAEAAALTGTEGTFAQKTLTAEKLYARATMSVEVVEDSNPGLLQWLMTVFAERMAGELDKEMVVGDGTTPAITGIKNASGVNLVTSATAAGRALTYGLLVQAFTAAGEQSAISSGVWIMSPRGLTEVLSLADTTGQPIVKLGTVETAPAGTIFGRPIIVSNRVAGAGNLDDATNDNTSICYGPLSTLIAGTRSGMTWDVTDQVGWANFQLNARMVGRFAGVVGIPAAWSRITKINTPAF